MAIESLDQPGENPIPSIAVSLKVGEVLKREDRIIEVDPEFLSGLLRENGVHEESIPSTLVTVGLRGSLNPLLGTYKREPKSDGNHSILLNVGRKQILADDLGNLGLIFAHEARHAGDSEALGHKKFKTLYAAYGLSVTLGVTAISALDVQAHNVISGGLNTNKEVAIATAWILAGEVVGGAAAYITNPFEIRARRASRQAAQSKQYDSALRLTSKSTDA